MALPKPMVGPLSGKGQSNAKFDRVVVPGVNGGVRNLTKQEYEALPLPQRIAYIVEGKAQFFLKGQPVTSWEALKD